MKPKPIWCAVDKNGFVWWTYMCNPGPESSIPSHLKLVKYVPAPAPRRRKKKGGKRG